MKELKPVGRPKKTAKEKVVGVITYVKPSQVEPLKKAISKWKKSIE